MAIFFSRPLTLMIISFDICGNSLGKGDSRAFGGAGARGGESAVAQFPQEDTLVAFYKLRPFDSRSISVLSVVRNDKMSKSLSVANAGISCIKANRSCFSNCGERQIFYPKERCKPAEKTLIQAKLLQKSFPSARSDIDCHSGKLCSVYKFFL